MVRVSSGVRAVAKPALRPAMVGLAGLMLAPAIAQAAPAETAEEAPIATAAAAVVAADDQQRTTTVAPVEVTAARRRESENERLTASVLDTPKSITIIGRETIRQSGSLTLEDALRTSPGITFTSGEGGTPTGDRPNVRGFDASSDIFVDGIRDPGGQSREVFNLEQIEVIKGPGSTFTGRGSTGGSINLVTKTARPGQFIEGAVTLGTDETRRATADVNHQINDSIAVRLNAVIHENEVAGRDAVGGERWGVAPSIVFGLNGPTRLNLDYYHLETDELPDFGLPYERTTVGGVVYGSEFSGDPDTFYGLKARDFRETSADIGTIRFEHDFNERLTLSNATRYGRTTNAYVWTNPDDSRGNIANGYLFRSSKNRNTETESLYNVTQLRAELATGGINHTLLAGLEIGREETHNQGYVLSSPGLGQAIGFPVLTTPRVDQAPTANNPGCSAPGRLGAAFGYNCTTVNNPNPNDPWIGTVARSPGYTDTEVETLGVYLFDTIEFNEQWLLNLGVRYDDYSNSVTGVTAAVAATAPFFTLTPAAPLSNESDFVNYQIGLVYKPRPNASIYLQFGTSSNPSGEGAGDVSGLAATTVNLDPEENESYELGAKYDAFGGQLRLAAAVFRTDKTNARVTDANNVISTVGNSRVQGVELEASGRITERWSVTGGYTYLDSEVRDGGFTIVNGVPTPSTSNGKRFPNIPEHSVSLWSTYDVTDALTLGAGVQSQSERFANATNTYKVRDFVRLDASAAYQVNERISLQLNLQNLTDERYALRPFTTHGYQVAPGRSALLTALVTY